MKSPQSSSMKDDPAMSHLRDQALEIQRNLLLAIEEGTPELKLYLLERLHSGDFTNPEAGKNFAKLNEENRSLFLDDPEIKPDPDSAYFSMIRELLHLNRAIELIPAMNQAVEALRGDPSSNEDASERIVSTILKHAERIVTLQTPATSWEKPSERLLGFVSDICYRYETHASPIARVRWHLRDLDQLTKGLQPGSLYLIVGEQGAGKTSFILGHAIELAKDALNSALITADATVDATLERLLASASGIDPVRMATNQQTHHDWPRLIQACDELTVAFPYLFSALGLNGTELISLLMQISECKCPDVLFIDDINRIRNMNDLFSTGTHLLDLIKRLVHLAREWNIPIVATVGKIELPTSESMNSLGRMLSLLDYANTAFAATLEPTDEFLDADGEYMIHHLRIDRNVAGPKPTLRIAYNHDARRFEDPPD